MSFTTNLEKYPSVSFSGRDKGYKFERLIQAQIKTTPINAYQFKNFWLWNEFLSKKVLGAGDTWLNLLDLTY